MNKVFGVFAIGVGLILIVIGITGTQSQVLAGIKAVNPKLRNAANSAGTTTSSSGGTNSGTNSGTVAV